MIEAESQHVSETDDSKTARQQPLSLFSTSFATTASSTLRQTGSQTDRATERQTDGQMDAHSVNVCDL